MADLHDQLALQVSQPSESSIVNLLEKCKAEIARLELQLGKQYEIKATLEDTFSSLRRASSVVRRLPEEILVYIFLEILREDPMAIGPVLLVCRQWNRVACNTPTLWTNIVSEPDPNPASIIRRTKYVQTALRNSQALPLNVTLKLPSPTRLWWDIAERIWPNLSEKDPEYTYYSDARMKQASMVRWLSDVSRKESEEEGIDGHCTRYREVTDALHSHVNTFVMDEQKRDFVNLDRICSLTIYFDSNEYEDWVNADNYHLLESFTPMPESLSIIDETTITPEVKSEVYINSNPYLERLCWKAAYSSRTLFYDDANLLHLRLYWMRTRAHFGTIITNLPSAIHTKNLRQLFLHCEAMEEDIGSDRADLFFPQLEDLALAGLVHKTIFEALVVPRLSTLRLFDSLSSCCLFNQTSRLPMFSIDKLHVHEQLFTSDQFTIEQVFKLFPSISQLGILGDTVDLVEKCLRGLELRNDGVSLKGYQYSKESFWDLDSYEHQAIVVNS